MKLHVIYMSELFGKVEMEWPFVFHRKKSHSSSEWHEDVFNNARNSIFVSLKLICEIRKKILQACISINSQLSTSGAGTWQCWEWVERGNSRSISTPEIWCSTTTSLLSGQPLKHSTPDRFLSDSRSWIVWETYTCTPFG